MAVLAVGFSIGFACDWWRGPPYDPPPSFPKLPNPQATAQAFLGEDGWAEIQADMDSVQPIIDEVLSDPNPYPGKPYANGAQAECYNPVTGIVIVDIPTPAFPMHETEVFYDGPTSTPPADGDDTVADDQAQEDENASPTPYPAAC